MKDDLQKSDSFGFESERKKILTSSTCSLACLSTNLGAFNEKKLGLEPSMNSRPRMVAKSKSELEPSSRAIFLRPPTQLTQEDLELIEQRVEIKVNFYFV